MIGFYTDNGKAHIEFSGNIVTLMSDTVTFIKEMYKGFVENDGNDAFIPKVYKEFVQEKLYDIAFGSDSGKKQEVTDEEVTDEMVDKKISEVTELLKGLKDVLEESRKGLKEWEECDAIKHIED